MFDRLELCMVLLPEVVGNGKSCQDIMGSIAWEVRGSRFVDVAKVHGRMNLIREKRLGSGRRPRSETLSDSS